MSEKKKTHIMNPLQLQRHRFYVVRRLLCDILAGVKVSERRIRRVRKIIDDWARADMMIDEQLEVRGLKGEWFDYSTMRWTKGTKPKENL